MDIIRILEGIFIYSKHRNKLLSILFKYYSDIPIIFKTLSKDKEFLILYYNFLKNKKDSTDIIKFILYCLIPGSWHDHFNIPEYLFANHNEFIKFIRSIKY
jgi:hypothetical protein